MGFIALVDQLVDEPHPCCCFPACRSCTAAGGSHPVLSRLGASLKKLGDLERGITRAFHGTTRPANFAALLHTFSRRGALSPALGGAPPAGMPCACQGREVHAYQF